jgi:aspartyl aminopeptidase
MKSRLLAAGFIELNESQSWDLKTAGRYFVTRNDTSIIAFVKGSKEVSENGIRMTGAHTDSPGLMIKPQPEKCSNGYFQLAVEVYGGALLNPWFDRDLSIAGRVVFNSPNGKLQKQIVDFKKPIAFLPSLAIHLDREANSNRSINPQTDILPILHIDGDDRVDCFRSFLAEWLTDHGTPEEIQILDYELHLYDTNKPVLIGLYDDFIAGARLDNLLSCYVGMQSLINSGDQQTTLLVCNDHEEVGSTSACGAKGPMLATILERIVPDFEQRARTMTNSVMISADSAHGIHPNYPKKHDENHGPLLNKGPVIKVNYGQSYASNSHTSSMFRNLCEQVGVPMQTFVSRCDMGCGSTIGPITAAEVGVPTLDVGVPTFGMHSIRELAGSEDAHGLYRVLSAFYNTDESLALSY